METVALTIPVGPAGKDEKILFRKRLPFHSVNRRGCFGYCKDMQRHHLLPRQLLKADYFDRLFLSLGQRQIGFDDFRTNGLLLPATATAALSSGLPLHRGPHRLYNELVAQRVGRIEAGWNRAHLRTPLIAREEALMRVQLLQGALAAA